MKIPTLFGEKEDTRPSETEKKRESLEWGEHSHQNVQGGSGPLTNSTRNSEQHILGRKNATSTNTYSLF